MLTIRAATNLLAQTNSFDALPALAHLLGFDTTPIPVSTNASHTLGLTNLTHHVAVARGPGLLRALLAQLPHTTPDTPSIPASTDSRELTRRITANITRNAPTRLWLILTIDAQNRFITIATVAPSATTHTPRVNALRIDRTHPVDSDADTLRALTATPHDNDQLCHARWNDILGRDALSARFYRTLESIVQTMAHTATGSATPPERNELALLCTSRLLFLAFLEAKGWLANNRNFLLHHCTNTLESGGQLHNRLLKPLFFGTLNTPIKLRAPAARAFGHVPFLNGGLFSATPLERKRSSTRFSDDSITALIGNLLDRFRFTAREDSSTWSEAAVDPEMLGRAFECLMARDERRSSGSFYTPPTLVEHVVHGALVRALPTLAPHVLTSLHTHDPIRLDHNTREQLHTIRILDPACGSGAFLVHTLELLASLHTQSGDTRPAHTIRSEILTRSIFGVDRNPMAVWLCELRLWLSVVIECPESDITRIPPLPNLDHHIRVGDSLTGGDFHFAAPSARTLTSLRNRYTRATGHRKHTLGSQLDREERNRAIAENSRTTDAISHERRTLLATIRRRDLFGTRTPPTRNDRTRLLNIRERLNELRTQRRRLELGSALPFRFAAHFADVAPEGFTVVLGNPPWVRPHHLTISDRTRLRREFRTLRDAPWRAGASRAGAGTGFAAQADLSVAFVERATSLLSNNGVLALLLPAKLWRALAGGGVRRFLNEFTHVSELHDWSDAPPLFDAATYPSLLIATRKEKTPPPLALASAITTEHEQHNPPRSRSHRTPTHPPLTHITVSRKTRSHTFAIPNHSLPLANDPAAPWLLLPPHVRTSFERLRTSGTPLGDTPLGRPLLGVKCGCNAAFLVHAIEHDDDTATIHSHQSENDHAIVERSLLRPALRGDAITTRGIKTRDLRIIWTHSPQGSPLPHLPPRTARWLARWRPRLETRRDARSRQPWWTLFRTESARTERARLVWADIGKQLRTTILPPGDPTVALNTCYVLPTTSVDDALALETLLTSPIASAWLDTLAEPARGGWRRFLGWTVAALPIPHEWIAVQPRLADLGRRRTSGEHIHPDEHNTTVADAFGIPYHNLTPLLEWWQQ